MTPLRLIFLGSPDFALPTLGALIDANHEIVAVYTHPPRPTGRGHHEKPCPVHTFAEARGLKVRTPETLSRKAEQEAFVALEADAAVVVAYGFILPKVILNKPHFGCLNVHASLLPRWRGAAPIQRALLAGDNKTGVTIMQIDKGLDTGPVLMRKEIPIDAKTTATRLHDDLAEVGAKAMTQTLERLAAGKLRPVPQPEDGVTYAAKLNKDDGLIDWRRPAIELERAVRALNPWPGVWFEHMGERIKLLHALLVAMESDAEPGTVIGVPLVVACGEGALACMRLQRPAREALEAEDFLRGYSLPGGTRLG